MAVAVITDSTAYLPADYRQRYSVRSVPLHVSVDSADAVPEHELAPDALAAALESKRRVTTAGATSEEFARAYCRALDSGAEGVVSVHLSGLLSGTWDAARLAASEVDPKRVRVVDSRSTAMGLGFSVLTAAAGADAGANLSTVESLATSSAGKTTTVFSVQTLEYLRRGGRIGTAAAVLGTALAIKPLLSVQDGRIGALEKVRTTTRAMARLLEISLHAAGSGPVSIAVHHLAAPERAEQLATRIREQLPNLAECMVTEVGAVIGAHVGPGALGVVVLPGGWRSPGS